LSVGPKEKKRPPGIANLPIGVVAVRGPLGFVSVGTGFQPLKGLDRDCSPQGLLAPSKSAQTEAILRITLRNLAKDTRNGCVFWWVKFPLDIGHMGRRTDGGNL
jgi:hypothetical protein